MGIVVIMYFGLFVCFVLFLWVFFFFLVKISKQCDNYNYIYVNNKTLFKVHFYIVYKY